MAFNRNEFRKLRLTELIKSYYSNSQAKFSQASGISANLVSRYVTGSKVMGEKMCEKIEIECDVREWFDMKNEMSKNNLCSAKLATYKDHEAEQPHESSRDRKSYLLSKLAGQIKNEDDIEMAIKILEQIYKSKSIEEIVIRKNISS